MTEQEMRAAQVPTLNTMQELTNYIETLEGQRHDYGTCVYAMSMAACAAYRYMANKLGVTGFQASCADMDIIRRNRSMEGPFMLIDVGHALYPQYDLHGKLSQFLAESKPWLQEQAKQRLSERNEFTSPAVVEHWKRLAGGGE